MRHFANESLSTIRHTQPQESVAQTILQWRSDQSPITLAASRERLERS
jgi:hypothetical protein